MITIEKTIQLPDTYPLSRLGPLDKLLFFDIETTGFSGEYTQLYLIGCTCYRNHAWHLFQWFADSPDAEADILHAFFRFMAQFTTLVHFNGDGFDIPYLQKRCQSHNLPYDFSAIQSVDIYKKIKPYRQLLDLENLKQKSIEQFLGIHRQDKYTGGQLIQVYADYLQTHEDHLYDLLMLHNREDLEGMPLILPILNYPDFLEHPFTLTTHQVTETRNLFHEPEYTLSLSLQSPCSLPVPIHWSGHLGPHPYHASAMGTQLTLELDLLHATLNHYYPDPQNYYYLPYEDTAIHKSIGEYVEKPARQKATPKTCYTKKEALFLPQPLPLWEPIFKQTHKDKLTYTEYTPSLFEDPKTLNTFISEFIKTRKK